MPAGTEVVRLPPPRVTVWRMFAVRAYDWYFGFSEPGRADVD